jgi:hypothetical protein
LGYDNDVQAELAGISQSLRHRILAVCQAHIDMSETATAGRVEVI